MNFKFVEREPFTQYKELESDYLTSDLKNEAIRKKYELTHKAFSEIIQDIKTKHGLSKRPLRGGRYYSIQGDWFYLSRRINSNRYYYGIIPIDKPHLLVKALELCKEIGWENEIEIRHAIQRLKNED